MVSSEIDVNVDCPNTDCKGNKKVPKYGDINIQISSEDIVNVISKAYYEAAVSNANMKNAVEELESIRESFFNTNEAVKMLDILVTLRSRFEKLILEKTVFYLNESFHRNKQERWKEWLRIISQYAAEGRGQLCFALSQQRQSFRRLKIES
jgi:hypothetical protein